MDLLDLNGYNLTNLARKNIVLGKNGCGKSHLLRLTEEAAKRGENAGVIQYLSPERGGTLEYLSHVDQNLTNLDWITERRRKNQASEFRQESAAQFRRLEGLVLREIEQNPVIRGNLAVTFDTTIERINKLLDRVAIKRGDRTLIITDKATGAEVGASSISSGESELISLAIECLVFEKEHQPGKLNILLMDEPDVHLHPDLQARFAKFVEKVADNEDITILIATHSTALLGAMSEDDQTRIAFIQHGQTDISFSEITATYKKILPVFGAHPLSNVFNQAPVLLLEGEDDERLWQQAVRSAGGRIKVYPCSVDGVSELSSFERDVATILASVYDNAVGYSLRDRDLDPVEIDDVGAVHRMRLRCRASENLLLADEVLSKLNIPWNELEGRINGWLANNTEHPHYAPMKAFADTGFDRGNADLKNIRNDLVGLMGSNKPWEVIVGQTIASTQPPLGISTTSLISFLGADICASLLGIPASWIHIANAVDSPDI